MWPFAGKYSTRKFMRETYSSSIDYGVCKDEQIANVLPNYFFLILISFSPVFYIHLF